MKRQSVFKTARLVDREVGTIGKTGAIRLRIALVYPNSYAIGMSNLGFQTVYRLFNDIEGVCCERLFLPTASGKPPPPARTLETGRPMADVDVIAFSIAFENDYAHLLQLLAASGLPLRSDQRHSPRPLVIAGGVACFLNPEPLAPFVDCFLIGEAESVIPPFTQLLLSQSPGGDLTAASFLTRLAQQIAGVYVPALYRPEYHDDGTLADFYPLAEVPDRIRPPLMTDLAETPTCSSVLTPDTTFADTFLVEVGRGCHRGCRFCAAGFVYRPPRFRPLELLEKCLQEGITRTRRIGLVGAAVADLPGIGALCRHGLDAGAQLSFSSLRADALDDQLLEVLRRGRIKTATIAPEAGSEKLRRVINKGLDQQTILKAVDLLVAHDILNVKLYFMVGLPTETRHDVDAVVALCKKIKHRFLATSRAKKRIGTVTVSLNCFVPKPFTPFQWVAMDDVGTLKQKLKKIKDGLKRVPNVRVHADLPRWAYVQALLSRGDRRVADILQLAYQNNQNWTQTMKASPLNADFYVQRQRGAAERFPWEFIDHGVRREYLYQEYQRALQAKPSPVCRPEICTACGVCRTEIEKRT